MDVMRAVDVSAWTQDIAPQAWESMKSWGIELAIIQGYGGGPEGLGRNHSAPQQARGAVSAGLLLAGYSWPPSAVIQALDNLKGAGPLLFMALDVEAGAAVFRSHVDAVASANVHPVIYTSRSQWVEIMSNDEAYSDVDLWEAFYPWGRIATGWPTTINTGLAPPPGLPRRVGWQWRGTTPLFGESVDLSVFDRAWVLSLGGQEDEMAAVPRLVQMPGAPAIYAVVGAHLEAFHSWDDFVALGYDKLPPGTVEQLPPTDPIWRLGKMALWGA